MSNCTVSSDYIYLDYAATAPLCEEAARAMEPYLVPGRANLAVGGNANTLSAPGRSAFEDMEGARRTISQLLGASRPDEIVFTSGATEADNAALFGLTQAVVEERQRSGQRDFKPHVITTALEHDAVLEPARRLEANGYEVTYLASDSQGFVSVEALEDAINDNTVLVSIQMANSEIGSIQRIEELAGVAHDHNVFFHTDAVQALGKVPLNLGELKVDAASFSAHKIGGPKGIGVFYLRNRTPFMPTILGGGQENARRSGTQNVCGMVGMSAALEAAVANLDSEQTRLGEMRDDLYERLAAFDLLRSTVCVERGSCTYLPTVVHVLVHGFESETLVLRFDTYGIGVSGGSACSSRSLEQSHVLKAIGITGDDALGALRVSMGRYTTKQDIDAFVSALPKCLVQ